MFYGGETVPVPPVLQTELSPSLSASSVSSSPLLDIAQQMHSVARLKGGAFDKHTKRYQMQELSKLHFQAGQYVKNLSSNDESKFNFLQCAQHALQGGSHYKILGPQLSQELLKNYY